MNKKAGIMIWIWLVFSILMVLFLWKMGLLKVYWEFVRNLFENKIDCLIGG